MRQYVSTDQEGAVIKVTFIGLAVWTSLVFAQHSPSTVTVLRDVTVVNVVTGEELKEQTVVIADGLIKSVDAISPTVPSATVIDAHGGYLIPGLWDMHIHVHDVQELPVYVANGVTGVRMMAGERDSKSLRRELFAETPSPEIILASAIVDGSSPTWPGSIVVKAPADARRVVDQIKASEADFIKVYDGIPRDAYFALADEAKQRHIDFAGHVPTAITAQEASSAGQRSIEHLGGIAVACSDKQEELNVAMERAHYLIDKLVVEAEGIRSFNQAKCQALFAEFRRNDTWQVPTLTVLRVWGRLNDSKTLSDPRLASVKNTARNRWSERTRPQIRRWNAADYQMARVLFSLQQKIVGGMFRAGVPLLAGTDAMNPYCFPGFSLHDELALLVDSGLTPLAALQTATINPARFLRRTSEIGTIEAGKEADMVLLRLDPLADIHNTTSIQGVWLHGVYFDHDALSRLQKVTNRK